MSLSCFSCDHRCHCAPVSCTKATYDEDAKSYVRSSRINNVRSNNGKSYGSITRERGQFYIDYNDFKFTDEKSTEHVKVWKKVYGPHLVEKEKRSTSYETRSYWGTDKTFSWDIKQGWVDRYVETPKFKPVVIEKVEKYQEIVTDVHDEEVEETREETKSVKFIACYPLTVCKCSQCNCENANRRKIEQDFNEYRNKDEKIDESSCLNCQHKHTVPNQSSTYHKIVRLLNNRGITQNQDYCPGIVLEGDYAYCKCPVKVTRHELLQKYPDYPFLKKIGFLFTCQYSEKRDELEEKRKAFLKIKKISEYNFYEPQYKDIRREVYSSSSSSSSEESSN